MHVVCIGHVPHAYNLYPLGDPHFGVFCSTWEPLWRLPSLHFSEFLTPSAINWCEWLFSVRSQSKSRRALQQLASYRIVQFMCPPRNPVGFCSSLSCAGTTLTICLDHPARSYTLERAPLYLFFGSQALVVWMSIQVYSTIFCHGHISTILEIWSAIKF